MSYSQKTSHYGIPVLGYGDRILPDIELKKWQLVENLLLACLRGESTAIFGEGNLTLEYHKDRKIYAVMRDAGNGVICRGISGGAYFEATKPIEWGPLAAGTVYFLEINANAHTFEDPSSFITTFSTMSSPSEKVALVASVDLRGDVFKIDRYPSGKNCPAMLMRHIEDNDNPHGELVYQTNLVVKNSLEADMARIGELHAESLFLGDAEIKFGDNEVRTILYRAHAVGLGENVFVPDIKNFRIVFVQSMVPFSEISVADDGLSFRVVNQSAEVKSANFLVSVVAN